MHELSIIKDIVQEIERIAKESGASKVSVVRVKLGSLSHCTPEHFREHFVEEARNSLAAEATLEVSMLPDEHHHPLAQEVVLESIEIIE